VSRNVEQALVSRLNRENIMSCDGNYHSCNDHFVGSACLSAKIFMC
jgi:hypothetical protein